MGEARKAWQAADAANRSKAEFLAVMSHELRTPLNSIGGYVDLLEMELRGPLTDSQKSDLQRIKRGQEHLLRIINDILNFTRLEATEVKYELIDVPDIEDDPELELIDTDPADMEQIPDDAPGADSARW